MPEKEKVSDKVKKEFASTQYRRDTKNALLGGVISGFAKFTGWDVTLLRVLFVFLLIFTAFMPLALAYLIIWICAPDESTKLASSKATKQKTESTSGEDGQTTELPQSPGFLIVRVILMVFGIIGFMTFIPVIIALIPITIVSIIAISSATITQAPLFITTAILVGVIAVSVVSIGLQVSTAMVLARLTRQNAISLVVGVIIIMVMTVAATTTGILWVHRSGKEGVESTWNSISEDMEITIDNYDGDHKPTEINVGPIHIRTN